MASSICIRGVTIFQPLLSEDEQHRIVEDIRKVASVAPFYSPVTPSGKRMSVRMTSAGQLGWLTDRQGYRYAGRHPSDRPWPPIPDSVLAVWHLVSECRREPDSCLINHYAEGARMGMHRDADEAELDWPVVSISLGDDALFRIGNTTRGGKTESVWLRSGDVAVLKDESRLVHHGIDRIKPGTSTLLARGGRLNLTLRIAGQTREDPASG